MLQFIDRLGSKGTSGRKCSLSEKGLKVVKMADGTVLIIISYSGEASCDILCCGRGFHARVRTSVEKCKCKVSVGWSKNKF